MEKEKAAYLPSPK